MHFIRPWADWHLQIQRHSGGPAANSKGMNTFPDILVKTKSKKRQRAAGGWYT